MLRRDLHLDVELMEGRYGELTVLVDGAQIITAGPLGFIGVLPTVRRVRELVESQTAGRSTSRVAPDRAAGGSSSDVRWAVGVGSLATLLGTTLVAVMVRGSAVSLMGWAVILGLLQLPMISAARRGHLDPCTAWLRRALGGGPRDA